MKVIWDECKPFLNAQAKHMCKVIVECVANVHPRIDYHGSLWLTKIQETAEGRVQTTKSLNSTSQMGICTGNDISLTYVPCEVESHDRR